MENVLNCINIHMTSGSSREYECSFNDRKFYKLFKVVESNMNNVVTATLSVVVSNIAQYLSSVDIIGKHYIT